MNRGTIFVAWLGAALLGAATPAAAATSSHVAIIGGTTLSSSCSSSLDANRVWSGGCLAISGTGFAGYTFSPLVPADVTAANLAGFDTVVLNMATYTMRCNTANLTAQARADLVAWVATGKKLIIFDSECPPQNYAWLPYPFTTANPGAMGALGTLNITTPSTLGTGVVADPAYIDAYYLGRQTDAVGDMNVMTSADSHWCVGLSGTNALNVTGAVHTWALYPAGFPPGADRGLVIYDGLDLDYLGWESNPNGLRKLWSLELAQPFAPSGLPPCVVTITGISLQPDGVTVNLGSAHTLTAHLSDLTGAARAGIPVSFSVGPGPNAGASGTCAPASCVSDAAGDVTFTYSGTAEGEDTVVASFTDGYGTHTAEAHATWQRPPKFVDPGGPYAVDEGGQTKLFATTNLTGVLAWEWDLDGDGEAEYRENPGWFDASKIDGPATFQVTVTVRNDSGDVATARTVVTVLNVAPAGNFLISSQFRPEGSTFRLSLSGVTDPAPADRPTLELAFDCGAGFGPFGIATSVMCDAADDAELVVRAALRDKDGGIRIYADQVRVYNRAPLATLLSPASGAVFAVGAPVDLSVSFTDAGKLDTHTCAVDWGDGTSGLAALSEAQGSGSCGATHAYATTGTFKIIVAVTDDDGSGPTKLVTVYVR